MNHNYCFNNPLYEKFKNLKLTWLLFYSAICLFNLHIFGLSFPNNLIFYPSKFIEGSFYSIISYPFIHASLYHLVLDLAAFIMLFDSLNYKTPSKILIVLFCIIGSALLSCINPLINEIGLCGLSGPTHGLFAVFGLMIAENKYRKPLGIFILIILILKCVFEIIFNDLLFNGLHLGNIGTPIVFCHTGGMIGGILGYYFLRFFKKLKR